VDQRGVRVSLRAKDMELRGARPMKRNIGLNRAALLKRRKKIPWTPFWKCGAQEIGAAKKLIVAGLPGGHGFATNSGAVPEVDRGHRTGEVKKHKKTRIMEAVKGIFACFRRSRPRFSITNLNAAYRTTRNRGDIKSRKAATILHVFASFRSFARVSQPAIRIGVREAENLSMAGAREITLIGQDTTSYGEDLGRGGLSAAPGQTCADRRLLWVHFVRFFRNRVTQNWLDNIRRTRGLAKYMDMPRSPPAQRAWRG